MIFLAIPAAVAGFAQTPQADAPGKDPRLSYRSVVDGTQQPCRVYVPSSYGGSREIPLVFALHGTGENENTFFDEPRIPPGTIKRLAEKYGVLLVSPLGRGTTEYRGTGENDVLSVLVDVEEHYRIDPDRVYLMGQSMGGTGSAYLALHHPDLFAAVAPLAAASRGPAKPWLSSLRRSLWQSGPFMRSRKSAISQRPARPISRPRSCTTWMRNSTVSRSAVSSRFSLPAAI